MPADDLVFVYGTLRRGQSNHALLARAAFLGEHTTEPGYTMLDLGWYPGVVQGGADSIRGELYRVDADTLAALDVLEDYPDLYTRKRIQTPLGGAWIYLYLHAAPATAIVAGGNWLR